METKSIVPISLICFTSLSGCDSTDGMGKMSDIGLEKKHVLLMGGSSSTTVNTQVSAWGIGSIKTADTTYFNTFYIKEENGNKFNEYRDTMAYDWFEVIKANPKELLIKAQKNLSGKKRSMTVTLAGGVGHMSADLEVVQEPK